MAEWPSCSLATRLPPGHGNTLVYQDRVFDEGSQKPVDRSVVIAGSEHFGLPTSTDSDILLMLIHLTKVRNGFSDRRVPFTRYELIRFLDWDEGGKSYRRLDESLQRWTNVTLNYKHAWWDRSGRKWRTRSFHVLESLELRGRDEVHDDGASSFCWNEIMFESFKAGNLKKIDLNTYFSLRLTISKQLYRFLDKRFFHSSRLEFSLTEFAWEHIGLSRNYDSHELKRKLRPALAELENIGFLVKEPAERRFLKVGTGKWRIVLRRSGKRLGVAAGEGIVTELTKRGVSRFIAEKLANEFPATNIEEKISLHDRLVARHDPRISKNSAGFLAAAIRDNYPVPVELKQNIDLPPKKIVEPRKELTARIHSQHVRQDAAAIRLSRAEAYLATLTPDEQGIVESLALSKGNRFTVETYHRLKLSDGKLFGVVRMELIATYLDTAGVFAKQAHEE